MHWTSLDSGIALSLRGPHIDEVAARAGLDYGNLFQFLMRPDVLEVAVRVMPGPALAAGTTAPYLGRRGVFVAEPTTLPIQIP